MKEIAPTCKARGQSPLSRSIRKEDDLLVTSLLYVSKSTLDEGAANAAVRAIVEKAALHNAPQGISGALLFTGTHFAQVLEGDGDKVSRLMVKIEYDTSHRDVYVVDRSELKFRRFSDWGMAYMGPSRFVARHIERLLDAPGDSEKMRAAIWLKELMFEFSKQ